jgi:hypothetical protein
MKKLELEHLAPYLPFELKYKSLWNNEIIELEDLSIDFNNNIWGVKIKPILIPLSSFEKTIAKDLMVKFSINLQIIQEIWRLIQEEITLDQISYSTYLSMCRNHIDFNGLIEAGLAIDKNSLSSST